MRLAEGHKWPWMTFGAGIPKIYKGVYVQSITAPSGLSALFMHPKHLTLAQRGFHIFFPSWKKSVRGSDYSINEEKATAKQFLCICMPSKYFLQLSNVHFDKHYEKFINVFWDSE